MSRSLRNFATVTFIIKLLERRPTFLGGYVFRDELNFRLLVPTDSYSYGDR